MFNLITLFSVYVCFNKVAEQGQTYLAINLCLFVASLDIVLLLLRWIWLDPSYTQGGSMAFACQLYRLVVVPLANTWMSWRVLHNLDSQPDFSYVFFLAVLLVVCIVVGSQVGSMKDPCQRMGVDGVVCLCVGAFIAAHAAADPVYCFCCLLDAGGVPSIRSSAILSHFLPGEHVGGAHAGGIFDSNGDASGIGGCKKRRHLSQEPLLYATPPSETSVLLRVWPSLEKEHLIHNIDG